MGAMPSEDFAKEIRIICGILIRPAASMIAVPKDFDKNKLAGMPE